MKIRVFGGMLVIAAAAALAPTTVSAQEVGVLAGFNSSNVKLEAGGITASAERRSGFLGGLYVAGPSEGMIGVEVDGLFTMKGTTFSEGGESLKLKLNYLDIPVLARVNLPAGTSRVFLLAGPSFNFKLSESTDPDEGASDDVKSFETGVVVGGGVMVGSFRVEARYAKGLTSIVDDDEEGFEAKNDSFAVIVGVRFR